MLCTYCARLEPLAFLPAIWCALSRGGTTGTSMPCKFESFEGKIAKILWVLVLALLEK
jgi:hypothetical protein